MNETVRQNNSLENVDLTAFVQAVGLSVRNMPIVQPKSALVERILLTIEKKKRFQVLVKMIIFSATSVISLFGLFFVWQTEGAIIINSEAGQLLSLLFSDSTIVLSMWRGYLVSLAESLPIVSIVLVAVFAWSLGASLWLVTRVSKKFVHSAFKHA